MFFTGFTRTFSTVLTDFSTIATNKSSKKSSLLPFPPDFFYDYNGKERFSTVTMEIAENTSFVGNLGG